MAGNLGAISDNGLVETVLSTTLGASPFGFFTTIFDTAIYTNGVSVPQAITNVSNVLAIAPLGGSPPVLLYTIFYEDCLFGAGNPSNPSRLYFSDPGTIDSWTPSNFIDVAPDDGGAITGLIFQFGVLIIFKETGIYYLTGTDPTNFILNQAMADVGCIAPKTLKSLNGIIVFLGRQGSRLGVYTFINGVVTRISQNIDPSLQFIAVPQLINSCAFVDFPYYYLSVPILPSTVDNEQFVFDSSINAWTHFTGWNANTLVSWLGGSDLGFIFYGDGVTSDIIQCFVGYQDQGHNYPFSIKTKYFDLQVPELVKLNKIFYLTKESQWPNTGQITYDLDFAGLYTAPINVTPDNWFVFPQTAQGQFTSIQFSDLSNNPLKLAGFSIIGEKWVVRPR